MDANRPFLMVACGNSDAGDDAFAIRVAQHLAKLAPDDLQIIDLGLDPSGLLDSIAACRALFVVDAAKVPGAAPGELFDVDYRELDPLSLADKEQVSSHGLGLAAQLALAAVLGWLPEKVRLIFTATNNGAIGAPMSAAVLRAVPLASDAILGWLTRWRNAPDSS